MSRKIPKWHGKTDDTPLPPRVKLRIFDRYAAKCAECDRTIVGRLMARFDHRIALINGGANCESNLQLLCHECHERKTGADVAEKSVLYRKRSKRLGLTNKRKIPGSRGSGIRRRMDGTVWRE